MLSVVTSCKNQNYLEYLFSILSILSFFSEVFKAKHRQTGKKVALKKVLMENEKEGVRDIWLPLQNNLFYLGFGPRGGFISHPVSTLFPVSHHSTKRNQDPAAA